MKAELIAINFLVISNLFLLLKVMKYKILVNKAEFVMKEMALKMSKIISSALIDKAGNVDEAIKEFNKYIEKEK